MINEQITVSPVRLIGADGTPHGVVELKDAKVIAEKDELDLVLINPNGQPPVCKVMDYGKYCFDAAKREKEAKKKQKVSTIKGMQLSLNIQENDMSFKAKNVRKFLLEGDKVKVTLKMFGRQLANPQRGFPIMDKFFEMLSDVATISSKAELNGRQIVMILSPINAKK